MSKNYVKAVLDYLPSLTSSTDTLVLLALAEYANDENRLAWPSISALIRRTRLDRRNIQRALRRLEASGRVSTTIGGQIENERGEIINSSSVYRLEFDHRGEPLQSKAPPKRALQRVQALPEARGVVSTPQAQTATPPPAHVPSPRLKKIATSEPARDLSAEKTRQLAALRQKITS